MDKESSLRDFVGETPDVIEKALEKSEIVYFRQCPIELPSPGYLTFLRDELPKQIKAKIVSYHHEADTVPHSTFFREREC